MLRFVAMLNRFPTRDSHVLSSAAMLAMVDDLLVRISKARQGISIHVMTIRRSSSGRVLNRHLVSLWWYSECCASCSCANDDDGQRFSHLAAADADANAFLCFASHSEDGGKTIGQHRDGEPIFDAGSLTTDPLAVTACMAGYISATACSCTLWHRNCLPIKKKSDLAADRRACFALVLPASLGRCPILRTGSNSFSPFLTFL